MTQIDRNQLNPLERDLTVWFAETAALQAPPYLDDILQQTAGLRQRPRWTFFERLIPMSAGTSFRAMTPPVPWRTVGALALLLLSLLVGAVLVASAQHRLPAPFGQAAAGLVAYDAEGDVFVVDPATNQPRSIVAGAQTDVNLNPQWSRDGTQIVFARVDRGVALLFTVGSDGSGLTQITPEGVIITGDPKNADYSFSPDGRTVLFLTESTIQIAQVDGSGVRAIPTADVSLLEAAFRPPNGSQIGALGPDAGIYLIDVADGTIQTVVAPDPQSEGVGLAWSPDGSEVAYGRWNDTTSDVADMRSYITDIATRQERRADPAGSDAFWEGWAAWSNDGRRIALMRGYTDGFADITAMIIATDGSGSRIETAHGLGLSSGCCAAFEWAPDDSSILWTPSTLAKPLLINPDTGAVTTAPWSAHSDPAWQRLAP